MDPSDETLVRRTLAGEMDAYGALVGSYRGAAYDLACHLVGDFEEPQDLTQEALVRAFYRLPALRDPARFAAWLRRIVASWCANWRVRELPRLAGQCACNEGDVTSPDPYQAMLARELGRSMAAMLARLPEASRLALIMCCAGGLSHREMGEFLGISADAVKMRIRRARPRMRDEMADLVVDALAERALGPSFAQEVGTMTVHFGISGHGDARSVFPDEGSRRLYAELYPRGDPARAAARADLPRAPTDWWGGGRSCRWSSAPTARSRVSRRC